MELFTLLGLGWLASKVFGGKKNGAAAKTKKKWKSKKKPSAKTVADQGKSLDVNEREVEWFISKTKTGQYLVVFTDGCFWQPFRSPTVFDDLEEATYELFEAINSGEVQRVC